MADNEKDPLGLDAVDRAIRINELEERLRELGEGETHVSGECPPEVHEQFLSHVVEYETAPLTTQSDELHKEGTTLPPPATMDGPALHRKLWEVIHALAARSCFLHHTNHLSDRELYTHLRTDSLKEEMPDIKPGRGFEWHIDLIGSGTDEDIEIGLRYYDDEEQRKRWAEDFPDMVIPPHEDPPYDRDRHLPKAPPMWPPLDEVDGDWDDGE
jgi:hypothetical protein